MALDLRGVRLLQMWQYAQQAERSLDEVIGVARRFGFTGILVKALDGTTWMGNVRSELPFADALRSVEQAKEQRARVNAAGLQYCLWTNPLWTEDRLLQAQMTAQLTGACDALFLDVEPYDQFWGANRPPGDAGTFMAVVRAIAPEATIVLQPDPRSGRFQEIRPDEWLAHCNALAGQHYWDTFQTDPTNQMLAAIQQTTALGVTAIPTLPLASTPEQLLKGINTLQANGITSWCVWRLGVGSEASLAAAGGSNSGTGTGGPLPPVVPAGPALRTTLANVLGGWSRAIETAPLSPAQAAQALFEIRSVADAIQRGEAG